MPFGSSTCFRNGWLFRPLRGYVREVNLVIRDRLLQLGVRRSVTGEAQRAGLCPVRSPGAPEQFLMNNRG